MLRAYRDWLTAELRLLGNASHHAYAFGQANMAKRAIDELDRQLAATLCVELDRAEAQRVLTELDGLERTGTPLPPGLSGMRAALQAAVAPASTDEPGEQGV